MNNLTTRKIVLGLLMALVLAFSVQGIADALTFKESRTGDVVTLSPNKKGFTIKFSVNLTSSKDIYDTTETPKRQEDEAKVDIDSSGYKVRGIEVDGKTKYFRISESDLVDTSGYVIVETRKPDPRYPDNPDTDADETRYLDLGDRDRDSEGDQRKAKPDDPVSDSLQHHYNDEAIGIYVITTAGGSLNSLKKGDANILLSGATAPRRPNAFSDVDPATVSLIEKTKNRDLDSDLTLTSSVTLKGEVAGPGVYTIKIVDMTHADDFLVAPVDPADRASLTFTIYSVPGSDRDTPLTLRGAGIDGYEFADDFDDPRIDGLFGDDDSAFDDAENIPLIYEVEGSGRVYVREDSGNNANYRDGSPKSQGSATKTLSTSSQAPVYLDMGGGSSTVTVSIRGQNPTVTAKSITFIYNYAVLSIINGYDANGVAKGAGGGRLEEHIGIRVTDAKRKAVPGAAVKFSSDQTDGRFIPYPGEKIYITSTGAAFDGTDPAVTPAANSYPTNQGLSTILDPLTPTTYPLVLFVQTDSRGEAKVYYQLGDVDEDAPPEVNVVKIETVGLEDPKFRATAVDDKRQASLEIVSGDGQRAPKGRELAGPLVIIARSISGYRIPNVIIEFEALTGIFTPTADTQQPSEGTGPGEFPVNVEVAPSGNELFVITDSDGMAAVNYNVGQLEIGQTVSAEVFDELGTTEYDFVIDRVIFTVNGGSSSRPPAADDEDDDDEDEDDTPPPASIVVPPTVTGTAGGTATLRVTAPATATVTAGGRGDNFLLTNVGSFTRSGTTYTSTLTLPNQVASYSLTVFVGNTPYQVAVSVTAAAVQTGGRLTVRVDPLSGAPGSTATVTVTATDSSAQPANATVSLRATGGTLASSSVLTGTTGTTTVTLTRGSTVGSENFVTVSATNYTTVNGRFVIAGPVGRDMTVGEAADLDDYDGNNQIGSLNSPLAEPLVVEVLDANDNPVEDARVRFSTTIGSGRFSPRTPRTDEDGFAETTFTPTSAGRIRISASVAGVDDRAAFTVQGGDPADALVKVSGDNQSGTPGNALANPFVVEVQDEDGEPLAGHSVTFAVTAGGGSLSAMSATADEDGLAETTLTLGSAPGINSVEASVSGVDPVTFSTSIDAKILVAAANRPVMYWIAGGGLYSLSGAKEAKIAESANGVAVGGGKIYWTSQVNASSGAINSANLDGTGATTLTTILAVPMGIAVDTAGSKLYWTNSRGRIQSANLDGSSIKNVMQNLTDPTDIVVSNGFIYWTEGGNSVRRVNISGQVKIAIDVAVNLNTVGGLAVGGGKVYWTEMTSASAGTVNGADLDGTNFAALATLLSAPMGISVDTAGSKLYWTNARGRVQSANLDGSGIKNVVEGLISPSKLAIGGANTETTTVKAATPAKKDNAKYDVNGDGTVDNTDASLVSAGFDTGNAKYDVNGDGKVSFLDLLLVFDNRDDDAAAAPAIVGMKLNAVQIDRIEEQIDLLIATNDRSPAAMRTLVYMQQLLATARPEKTQLFANYPNPFNPETWLPYELATDTHVKITIYNTQGVVIRTLQFGHQSAGYYTDRDRAAYWDGRNALGEQVASGLYFYQLETDEMSSMRKMVILK